MFHVNNFLVIFPLEVGGKFLGWFGLITNAIVLPLSIVFLVGISLDKDLEFIRDKLDEMQIETIREADENAISRLREYLILTLILVIIMSSVYLIASGLLLRGSITRNHRQLRPAKNILAFLALFSVFMVLMRFTINSMANAVLYIYIYAVLNSLWKKFRDEEENGQRPLNLQHFQPIIIQPKV